MNTKDSHIGSSRARGYFQVATSGQAYLEVAYLLLSFPLGIIYFVFLITGISLGLSLTIIWIGIPILLLVAFGSQWLAALERQMAIHWLKADVPPGVPTLSEGAGLLTRMGSYAADSVTWSSLLYLFLKFPLGILSFVVLATMLSLPLAFAAMPVLYEVYDITDAALSLGVGLTWHVDSLGDAFLISGLGILLLPATLHACSGVAWLHARLAKIMLTRRGREA